CLTRLHSTPLFFTSAPRPLSLPLFPYTTLFRSVELLLEHVHEIGPVLQHLVDTLEPAQGRQTAAVDLQHVTIHLTGSMEVRQCGDRKSTRLNSSHVKISYAVFCLKKKKTDQQEL